jgi:predicted nucleotidyltransferase
MELPPDIELLLSRLRAGLVARGDLTGLYVYGSLATGDFSPACSDIDVIVMVEREPDKAALGELTRLHEALMTSGGAAQRLNCLYVPVQAGSDPDRLHNYWFGNRWTHWQLKVMTQAELTSVGVALHGPWPPPGIAPVPIEDVQAAVYAEITGYWRRIASRKTPWLQDACVDHALTVLPRAEAVLTTGDLIAKSEAISRFADFGVPAQLAQEIRDRRDGHPVTLTAIRKVRRAYTARRVMKRGVRKLSSLGPLSPASGPSAASQ